MSSAAKLNRTATTSESEAEPEVLIIALGVQETNTQGASRLDGPDNDVELLRQTLTENLLGRRLSFHRLDPSLNDTEVRRSLKQLLATASPTTLVIFYFSGHADITMTGQFRLLLGGTTDVDVDGFDLTSAAAFVRARGVSQCVFMLDCCYAGAAAFDVLKGVGPESLSGYGYAILGASGPNTQAKINLSTLTSYMTEVFCEGLQTGACDVDRDGAITLDEIWRYCTRKLRERDDLRIWRSYDGDSDIIISPPFARRVTSIVESAPRPNDNCRVFSRWEPGLVLDAIRSASSRVQVLETWFPGAESDVARCGPARSTVDYEFILLKEQSSFSRQRIADRDDFSFLYSTCAEGSSDLSLRVEEKRDRSIDWLRRNNHGGSIWLYDAFVPGPIYLVDQTIHYGLFLPQVDADLAPMHRAPADSPMGQILLEQIAMLKRWAFAVPPSVEEVSQSSLEYQYLRRIEALELAVAWLQRPANGPQSPSFELIKDAQIIDGWNVAELESQIKTAKHRALVYQEWAADPDCSIDPSAIPRRVDARVVTLGPDGGFLRLRASALCGGRRDQLAQAQSHGQMFAKTSLSRLSSSPGLVPRINNSTFMPINICIIDDRIFYTLCTHLADPWRAPIHVLRADSIPGRAILAAFDIVWSSSVRADGPAGI